MNVEKVSAPLVASAAAARLLERFRADARTTSNEPRPFTGLAERADVLVDIEIDNVRYLLLVTAPRTPAPPTLSPRELEIARMITKGLPNKSIAHVLQISTWTVSSHLRRIFTKLGVNSRAEMVGRLLETGCLFESSGSFPGFDMEPPAP